jgi:hypothetical protein
MREVKAAARPSHTEEQDLAAGELVRMRAPDYGQMRIVSGDRAIANHM